MVCITATSRFTKRGFTTGRGSRMRPKCPGRGWQVPHLDAPASSIVVLLTTGATWPSASGCRTHPHITQATGRLCTLACSDIRN